MAQRVKVLWSEALDEPMALNEHDTNEEMIRTNGTSQSKKKVKSKHEKRKKRHPNDVKTKHDMDATVSFDDSSSSHELDDENDTFGGARFIMNDLERGLEEIAVEATTKGFTSVRTDIARKEEKKEMRKSKNRKERRSENQESGAVMVKERKEKTRKVKKTLQVLETMDVVAVKKSAGKAQKSKKKQRQVDMKAVVAEERLDQDKTKGDRLTQDEKKHEKVQSAVKEGKVGGGIKDDKKMTRKTGTNHQKQLKQKKLVPSNCGIDAKLKTPPKNDACRNGSIKYAEYLDLDVVLRGLETGGLFQGKLRVNAMYRMDGYISVDGFSMDVLMKGMQDRNRALDGDLVAIRLRPVSEWKPLNDDSKLGTHAAESKPMSSSAGVDQNALHSLWLPNVQTDQCFIKTSSDKEDYVNMLEQTKACVNERIKESRRRPTATVVYVLTRGNANGFVGSLEAKTKVKDTNVPLASDDNYAYFNADDLRLPRLIRIPRLQLPDEFISHPMLYSKTMLCFCRIKAWPTRQQSPTGEFVKTVGEYTGIETGISAILSKHGLQEHTLDFGSSILNELDEKYGTSGEKWEIPEDELQKRRDFRETQIFSIDPYNARDLDDALHIRALNDGRTKFEIGVHIADVTHFIEHNSLLDLEARSRGTSVYLVNRVLPMLPRILCEKLCSLQPQVDRLAFSVVWQMNLDGTLVEGVDPWFGKSVIRSCCKLDYGSAQKMLDGVITGENVEEWEEERRPIMGANPNITNATVVQGVKDLWSIGKNRRAMRFETGAVSLNDVKLVFSLDAKGNPIRYGSYELKNSNRLVEEYMLLANYLVAQQLLRAHGPLAFLRHHPPPVLRSMDQTLARLEKSDIKLDGSSTKQLTESLERIRQDCGETTFVIVQALIIKPMKPAEYMVAGNGACPDSWRHYALNIPYYTHFTSPIRRYADVVVHRLLQESLVGALSSNKDASDCSVTESRMVELTSVAQNCNEKKMTSENAEKECDNVFLCAFMRHNGDTEVTGIVVSMGQKSFTVYIMELGIEQRLFLQELDLTGSWNDKTLELSIELPSMQKMMGKKEDSAKNRNHDAMDMKMSSQLIVLSFMKQLRLRMSTTKKMPLMLTFSVLGVKKN
ncbi:unnamed protein product [Peronospora belbahrii]|uniref:RNB domain-containing protein n=1 Tax=Peronospora belbahrii TaxID=622444 RepID=A0AAU9L4R6_9STRA|nr:unnamed protein product [Peronospora belbahrii]